VNKPNSWFCKIFLKPLVDEFLIQEVEGQDYIPRTNFILVSNHQSHLDWIASACLCLPRRFTYLGQVDRYGGFLAIGRDLLYFIAGVIPVNRKDENSKEIALKKTVEVLKRGDILIIYPEGTRSRTGEIQKGKLGVAKIFLQTGIPILPVGISGTFELLPPGGKLKIKKIVKINVGQPLFFKEELEKAKSLDEESEEHKEILQKITNKVMEEINNLFLKL